MTALLDATTLTEYLTALGTSASAGAQAVIDALDGAGTVTAKVYDGSGSLKASGTMADPWATQSGGVITVAEVTGFQILGAGPVVSGWYIRFEAGTRWLRGSFGAVGSGAEITYTGTWAVGAGGELGVITAAAPSNAAPSLVGAPSSLSFDFSVGGTYDFAQHAVDPDGDTLTYSLVGTAYTGISINATTGVLTVSTTATAATRDLTIRVTDPAGLSSDWIVRVTINDADYAGVRHDSFDSGTVGALAYDVATYWDSLAYAPSSANTKIAAAPTRSGARCIETIVDRDLSPSVSNNERSEIVFDKNQPGGRFGTSLQSTPAGTAYVSTTDVWLGFSIYVPSDWRAMWKQTDGAVDYSNPDDIPIVLQFHKDSDGVTGGETNPWLTLRIKPSANNSSGVPAWTSTIEKNTSLPALSASTTSNPNGGGNRPVVLGAWTDVVIRARYHMWDGSADIWLKDSSTAGDWVRLAYRTDGVGYASDLKQPYIKTGSYLPLWDVVAYPTRQSVNSSNTPVRRWVCRHDETRFYYGNDGSIAHVSPR